MVNYLRNHPLASCGRDAGSEPRRARHRRIRGSSRRAITRRRTGASSAWSKRRPSLQIGKSWRALGYPFASLTPSYAAAVGASGDRPAALAQLIGTIANDGKTLPTQSIATLRVREGHAVRDALRSRGDARRARCCRRKSATWFINCCATSCSGGTAKRLADGITLPDGRDARRIWQDRNRRPALQRLRARARV